MFELLAAAIDDLTIPVEGEAVAEACRLLDRLTAKVTLAAGRFAHVGGFGLDGAVTMVGWLRAHTGMTNPQAAAVHRIGRRLVDLPATSEAWVDGRLTGGHVTVIAANVDDATAGLFADQESSLVPTLENLSVVDTIEVLRRWRACADQQIASDRPPEDARRSTVHLSPLLDGWGRLDATLDPHGHAVVAAALRLAESRDVDGEPARTPAQRRGDALVDVARWFLDNQHGHAAGRHRPHVNVVIDEADLAGGRPGRVIDGPDSLWVDGPTVSALLCDGALHRLLRGRSAVLDYGTATRTVPASLWSTLVIRDRHCTFPGCDRGPGWCDAHHVVPVERDGPTNLHNLRLRCSRHHHLVHQPDWQEKLLPDGTIHITSPAGRHWTIPPP